MKRLERPEAPAGLSRYVGGRDRWEDLDCDCKAEVTRTLRDHMQGGLCAYCEREVGAGAHIEHLARRRDHPRRTFDWTNLFISCGSRTTCGHYKDRPGGRPYKPATIIDPTLEDPHDHLLFRESGVVEARPGRTQERAQVTIEVLNLDDRVLRERRERELKFFRNQQPGFMETLQSFDPADVRAIIEDELAALDHRPCAASVRAFLLAALPD